MFLRGWGNVVIALFLVSAGFVGAMLYRRYYPSYMEYRKYLFLTRLAERDNPGYQRLLGEYFYDKGDFENALKWEIKAAEGGDPMAQGFMGIYFRQGINPQLKPKRLDQQRALQWFEKAAAGDDQFSQLQLCEMYQRGIGTASDPEKSYYWCSLADLYQRDAREFLELSRNSLNAESRNRVEQQVQVWKGAHVGRP